MHSCRGDFVGKRNFENRFKFWGHSASISIFYETWHFLQNGVEKGKGGAVL